MPRTGPGGTTVAVLKKAVQRALRFAEGKELPRETFGEFQDPCCLLSTLNTEGSVSMRQLAFEDSLRNNAKALMRELLCFEDGSLRPLLTTTTDRQDVSLPLPVSLAFPGEASPGRFRNSLKELAMGVFRVDHSSARVHQRERRALLQAAREKVEKGSMLDDTRKLIEADLDMFSSERPSSDISARLSLVQRLKGTTAEKGAAQWIRSLVLSNDGNRSDKSRPRGGFGAANVSAGVSCLCVGVVPSLLFEDVGTLLKKLKERVSSEEWAAFDPSAVAARLCAEMKEDAEKRGVAKASGENVTESVHLPPDGFSPEMQLDLLTLLFLCLAGSLLSDRLLLWQFRSAAEREAKTQSVVRDLCEVAKWRLFFEDEESLSEEQRVMMRKFFQRVTEGTSTASSTSGKGAEAEKERLSMVLEPFREALKRPRASVLALKIGETEENHECPVRIQRVLGDGTTGVVLLAALEREAGGGASSGGKTEGDRCSAEGFLPSGVD
uniref:Uncharacterized protein n=1 Tax=Chromera velia CCMP2878 TaxID=1169474 RepID=A0A0G4HWF8_9ALVE|eukprot:Cvel_9052.t1-p1 / transcript=Cvel_9052.t1 / gene=Cvel_9052 / organism=Chromera_velia_CCMP2878 / gene_product=hypothetical protein / transcript_product=hypothetical protein / location=Cvel_scaffold513:27553-29353(-) / protein_length=494 / sequence_SO=supercontig / SO=protein_coding / is_pseudo=false